MKIDRERLFLTTCAVCFILFLLLIMVGLGASVYAEWIKVLK